MSQEMLIATSVLAGLLVIAGTVLRAWQDWLALKNRELDARGRLHDGAGSGGSREGAARIELADLRERIRKLEAIASGVDL